MLVDKLRIDFASGSGGDGTVHFHRTGRTKGKNGSIYYPQKGKPDGGDGGKGGNIYFEGSHDLYDLSSLSSKQVYKAEDGKEGLSDRRKGKDGEDFILQVPLTTIVTDLSGKELLRITKHEERKLLIPGGEGGLGNYFFRQGQIETLTKHTKGQKGVKLQCFVELQLSSDIIFIGLPNAGKSSLLNALTNAHVKVASYPFTTLQPQLGIMHGYIRLMDLPGLVQGVSKKKGFGTSLGRHTIPAKLIAHCISLESDDVIRDYNVIREELAAFSPKLLEKPEIILLTKADMVSEDIIKEKKQQLVTTGMKVLSTSAFYPPSIQELQKEFQKLLNT